MSDTPEHTHTWEPIPGEMSTYRCTACPTRGHRVPGQGILPYKTKMKPKGNPVEVSMRLRDTGVDRLGKRGPGGWSGGPK